MDKYGYESIKTCIDFFLNTSMFVKITNTYHKEYVRYLHINPAKSCCIKCRAKMAKLKKKKKELLYSLMTLT